VAFQPWLLDIHLVVDISDINQFRSDLMSGKDNRVVISFRTSCSMREKLEKLTKTNEETMSDVVNRIVNTHFHIIRDIENFRGE
jgi:hypothetical protein